MQIGENFLIRTTSNKWACAVHCHGSFKVIYVYLYNSMKTINTTFGPNTGISVLKQVEHTVTIVISNDKFLIVRSGPTAARLLGLRV